ncbi:hypothetical protein ARMSODRAFT_722400 [Armillaria solidipes]|uniref:Uncharacterized protein n=1 Tax=Armillaria solidipes TaxID=1076256 RepID=A0A2H3B9V4_9AGAR|nr:hypothetical protein ARMSODRAFT_722400 [Armillaria solidipes]
MSKEETYSMVSHTVMVRREGPYRIVSCQREDWKISGEANEGCRRRAHLDDDDDDESDLWFFLPRSLLILLRARTKSSLPDQEARLGFSGIRARNRCCSTGVGGGRVLHSKMDNVFTTFSRRTGEFSSLIMSSCISILFLRKCILLIFESRKLAHLSFILGEKLRSVHDLECNDTYDATCMP